MNEQSLQLDPQQLAQLVVAARAAQQMGQGAAGFQNAAGAQPTAATSAVSSPGPGVGAGPIVDPQQLARLVLAARAPHQGSGPAAGAMLQPAQAPRTFVLAQTSPFAPGAGLGSKGGTAAQASTAPTQPDPAKATAIQHLKQAPANRGQPTGAPSTTGSASGQTGTSGPQIPLGAPSNGLPGIHKTTPLESIQGIVAGVASSKENSTDYLVAKSKGHYKAGSDKCNELVADTIEESGLPRPQVHYTNEGWTGPIKSMFSRDPDANEWANPKVKIAGWSEPRPLSEARPGDVIAQQHGNWGHAGVVVSSGDRLLTVSVNTAHKIPGLVTQNDWGFRPRGQNGEDVKKDPEPVVRHYIGK